MSSANANSGPNSSTGRGAASANGHSVSQLDRWVREQSVPESERDNSLLFDVLTAYANERMSLESACCVITAHRSTVDLGFARERLAAQYYAVQRVKLGLDGWVDSGPEFDALLSVALGNVRFLSPGELAMRADDALHGAGFGHHARGAGSAAPARAKATAAGEAESATLIAPGPLGDGVLDTAERVRQAKSEKLRIASIQAAAALEPSLQRDFEFWRSSPQLANLYRTAMKRAVEPWAAYASAHVHALSRIPPYWTCMPERGTRGSLNEIVLAVALSGGGKGTSSDVGRDAFKWPSRFAPQVDSPKSGQAFAKVFIKDMSASAAAVLLSPGAGAGAGSASAPARSDARQHVQVYFTGLLDYPEISVFNSIAGYNAIAAIMCSAWSGERLGGAAMDSSLSMSLAPGSYRMCVLMGVQAKNAGMVLKHRTTGLPQRCLFLPATSEQGDEQLERYVGYRGVEVAPFEVPELPGLGPSVAGLAREAEICEMVRGGQLAGIAMPDSVRSDIETMLVAQRVYADAFDELDQHAGMLQVSQAVGIAMMEGFGGRGEVGFSEYDWERAEYVMAVHRKCRAEALEASHSGQAEEAARMGREDGLRALAKTETMSSEARKRKKIAARVAERVGELTANDPSAPMSESSLLRGVQYRDRDLGRAELDSMVNDGLLRHDPGGSVGSGNWGRGVYYRAK